MTTYITCPNCKERDALKAEVDTSNPECDVVEYTDACPHCNHKLTIDDIAELQQQAQRNVYEEMLNSIHERNVDRSLGL